MILSGSIGWFRSAVMKINRIGYTNYKVEGIYKPFL